MSVAKVYEYVVGLEKRRILWLESGRRIQKIILECCEMYVAFKKSW